MISVQEKIDKHVHAFSTCKTWEDKYEKLISFGKAWPGLTEEEKKEDLKVKGCQSQVWISASMSEGCVQFKGDSDALLVRGLVALVLSVYSGETPETILKTEPLFLKEIGLDKGLSPSRSNGLFAMIKKIKFYATAYQYLINTKKTADPT